MYNPDKYQTARSKPSQARGKERVRVILAAALKTFQEHGYNSATTNEIAERAKIPIGSLYRYYPNKVALMHALIDLYVDDISELFDTISRQPTFARLGWDEVMLLLIDAWLNYALLNGPFDFLYSVRANPELRRETRASWQRFYDAFYHALRERCPALSRKQATVCFRLAFAIIDLGADIGFGKNTDAQPEAYYEAIQLLATYMAGACAEHHS